MFVKKVSASVELQAVEFAFAEEPMTSGTASLRPQDTRLFVEADRAKRVAREARHVPGREQMLIVVGVHLGDR